jgi:hypothetical protein
MIHKTKIRGVTLILDTDDECAFWLGFNNLTQGKRWYGLFLELFGRFRFDVRWGEWK